jgi:hypothetical protein
MCYSYVLLVLSLYFGDLAPLAEPRSWVKPHNARASRSTREDLPSLAHLTVDLIDFITCPLRYVLTTSGFSDQRRRDKITDKPFAAQICLMVCNPSVSVGSRFHSWFLVYF